MENPKYIVASGCSFTTYIKPEQVGNWPEHLATYLDCEPISHYLGSEGADNSYIANALLKRLAIVPKSDYKDIIVGVMWSGVSRVSFYFAESPKNYDNQKILIDGHYFCNFNIAGPDKCIDELSKLYYTHFYDLEGSLINTCKNILLVQQVLKTYNIKYFFSEYSYDCISNYKSHIENNPYLNFLFEQIDKSNFLPVENMSHWIHQQTGISDVYHPTPEMSYRFTHEVIIPFLKNKNYIRNN